MKKSKFLLAAVLFFVVFMNSVKAFPNSITLDNTTSHLTLDLDNNLTVTSEVSKNEATYPWILVKTAGSKNFIGLSEAANVNISNGTVCTLEDNWSGSEDSLDII